VEKNVSPNLVAALQLAKQVGARIIGIVGKDGGYTAKVADACVIVPTVNPNNVTPHSEAFQAVVWHLFVSHPDLKVNQTKWESVTAKPERMALRPAVFLDRDGTLNVQLVRDGKPYAPETAGGVPLFEGSPEACRRSRRRLRLVVATNQPDVGRGDVARETIEAMHAGSSS
jgi:hypothetical protein